MAGKRMRAVMEHLTEHGESNVYEMAKVMGVSYPSLSASLRKLVAAGEIVSARRGLYKLSVDDAPVEKPSLPEARKTTAQAAMDDQHGPVLCVSCRSLTERENPGRYQWLEAPRGVVCSTPSCFSKADAVGLVKVKTVTRTTYAQEFKDLDVLSMVATLNRWLATYSGPADNPVVVELVIAHEHLKSALNRMDARLKALLDGELKEVGLNAGPREREEPVFVEGVGTC